MFNMSDEINEMIDIANHIIMMRKYVYSNVPYASFYFINYF